MKGIILAGGSASRLFPITFSISKQLLPIYDKPMIYYSISTLMSAGIREILIIVSPTQIENFRNLLGDGSQFGINIIYEVQENPNGIPEAFIIGENFIRDDNVALILGDNIFYGYEFLFTLKKYANNFEGSMLFLYNSHSPENFGVVELSENKEIISINEKPIKPRSNYIVTGLYFYDKNVSYYSKCLTKSDRGELEITDLNNIYLKNKNLNFKILNNDSTWFDTGTVDSFYEASKFVKALDNNYGIKFGVPEEIGYKNGWITNEELERQAFKCNGNSYGKYLNSLIKF